MTMTTVALYCRVSTDEQAQHGYSIDNQRNRLVAYCQSQGWADYELYVDDGFTGTNLDRPALQRLLRDVRSGRIGMVVVYKLDRLSRKQLDVLHLLEDEFERYDVAFKSATEPFDTSTPLGKAMLGILAVFAQLERDTIVDRLSTGLRQRVNAGKWAGGRVPFGYRYRPETGKLEADVVQADIVRSLFHRFLRGQSLSELADWASSQTNARVFDHAVIRDLLQRRVYLGESTFGDASSSEIAQAIVEPDTFEQVQTELAKRRAGKRAAGVYLLSGLLRCDVCGAPFIHVIRRSGRGRRKAYYFYACKNQHHRSKRAPNPCTAGYRRQDELEAWVVEQVKLAMLDDGEFERQEQAAERQSQFNSHAETLSGLQADVKKIDARLERWYHAFEEGALEVAQLWERIAKLKWQREAYVERIAQLENERANVAESPAGGLSVCADNLIRRAWDAMTFDEQRSVLRAAVEVVMVPRKGEDPRIVWRS